MLSRCAKTGRVPPASGVILDQQQFIPAVDRDIVVILEVSGFGTAVGFTIAIVLLAGIRSRINEEDLPRPLRGAPVVLIAAALMSIAFMGFSDLAF
ncbi:MAG: hypothetical protein J6Y95_01625 [Lachnospiraceae bacterium]|nr:hypothetical protein [Lachnospiraceae bacterium]